MACKCFVFNELVFPYLRHQGLGVRKSHRPSAVSKSKTKT